MDEPLVLAALEHLLRARMTELEGLLQADGDRQQFVELDQTKVGRLSRMDALQQQAMTDAIRSRARAERAKIEHALKRMAKGDYGYCVQCGESIPAGRLAIDPATPFCVACASSREAIR